MTCTDQVLYYSNIGASALLLLGTILRFAIEDANIFSTIITIYMLIFDALLIIGLLVSQGHFQDNEMVKKVTVMFFAVTTVFGQGMIILLCSFLLLEVSKAAEIIIACICIVIGAVDMAIGYYEDPTVKFMEAEQEMPQVDDPADKMK